jgi:CHAD domain-containing protein
VAFEIRRGERLRHALKRASRAQLERARHTLRSHHRSPAERVHELRRTLKKVRALARLLWPTVGRPARAADHGLRACAREVARLRDAQVILQTFDDLCGDLPAPRGRSMRGARGRLATRLEDETRLFE